MDDNLDIEWFSHYTPEKGYRAWNQDGQCKYFNSDQTIPEGFTDSMPQELREKYSISSKGINNGMYGKKQSEETRKLISLKAKARPVRRFEYISPDGSEIKIRDKGNGAKLVKLGWTLGKEVFTQQNNE